MTFRKFLYIYKRHIRLASAGAVAAFALLIVTWAITGFYYTAELRIFTTPPAGIQHPLDKLLTLPPGGTQQELSPDATPNRLGTLLTLASSQPVLQAVIRKLELRVTVQELEDRVSISQEDSTGILRVSVTASEPREAKVIAQTLGEEFLAYIDELNKQEVKTTRTFLEEQFDQARRDFLDAKKRLYEYEHGGSPPPEQLAQTAKMSEAEKASRKTLQEIKLKSLLLECSFREKTYWNLARQVDEIRVQEKMQNKLGTLTLMGPPLVYRGHYTLLEWVRMKFGSSPDVDHQKLVKLKDRE